MSEKVLPSVIHWGGKKGANLPTTNLALSSTVLAVDAYFSKVQLNIRSKIEYKIPANVIPDFLEDLEDAIKENSKRSPSILPVAITNGITDFLGEAYEWLTATEDKDVYVTIPLAGLEREDVERYVRFDSRTTITFHEKIYSTLVRVSVKEGPNIVDLDTFILHAGIIKLSKYAGAGKLIINNVETTPCTLCKYSSKRINGYCIYYNGDIDCLFTNALPPISGNTVDITKLATALSKLPGDDLAMMDNITEKILQDGRDEDYYYPDELVEELYNSEFEDSNENEV